MWFFPLQIYEAIFLFAIVSSVLGLVFRMQFQINHLEKESGNAGPFVVEQGTLWIRISNRPVGFQLQLFPAARRNAFVTYL